MQGTIVKVAVEEGQTLAEGDVVVVLEAMKMEQPLKAHKAGTVTGLQAEVGATVHQRRRDLRAQGLTLLPIAELDASRGCSTTTATGRRPMPAAALWGRGRAVFVRSSATHVFRAEDLVLRMAPIGTPQSEAVARRSATAETLAALDDPRSVPSRAGPLVERVDGMVVTALRVVSGTTYDDDELTSSGRRWGSTLALFHATGYVHGDPEPDNLVVDAATAHARRRRPRRRRSGDPVADIAFALRLDSAGRRT